MEALGILLIVFVLICAISVAFSKNLLQAIIIFMSQSLAMSIIWMLLESPDLAITEAAVGAGIDTLLLFVTLKKIHAIDKGNMDEADAPVLSDLHGHESDSGLKTRDLSHLNAEPAGKEEIIHG